MAILCCRTVFPETKAAEWQVATADGPATTTHCYLDLVHNSAALDFSFVSAADRPETFGPFIRVANSYNTLRALSFNIGFFRKVCKNGLILPDAIIQFKFTHSRQEIPKAIKFEIAHEQLAKLKTSFTEFLGGLRSLKVEHKDFAPLIRHALSLQVPEVEDSGSRDAVESQDLANQLAEMSDRYARELGENAYAVFNAVTEFASQPPVNRFIHRDRHSLQRLAGKWFHTFGEAFRKPGFSIAQYLNDKPENPTGQTTRMAHN